MKRLISNTHFCFGSWVVTQLLISHIALLAVLLSILYAGMLGPNFLWHDPHIKDADNPCSFCLSTGQSCTIHLVKHKKAGSKIDMVNSCCPNLKKIRWQMHPSLPRSLCAPMFLCSAPCVPKYQMQCGNIYALPYPHIPSISQPFKLWRPLFYFLGGDNFDKGYLQAASKIQEIQGSHIHTCNIWRT